MAGLVVDTHGSLYGTTMGGGHPSGDGIVFELLSPGTNNSIWKELLLYTFSGGELVFPMGSLSFDSLGDLYGTASEGGKGSGGIFRLAASRAYKTVYAFKGQPDGVLPESRLVFDNHTNVYGTTRAGGDGSCQGGCGTVFEISP
jgi:uncharacterized repeat protein (TIGR03803 family)